MNLKTTLLLAAAAFMMAGCKKDGIKTRPAGSTVKTVKTTVYLVSKAFTNYLDSPLPRTQTDSFTYNSNNVLVKHTVTQHDAYGTTTRNYLMVYDGDKLTEVDRQGGSDGYWRKTNYTYTGNTISIVMTYTDRIDTMTVTLNNKGLADKLQATGGFFLFTYDASGNITQRDQYQDNAPDKVTFSNAYTYDDKHSPYTSLQKNTYLVYQAFNDVDYYLNNRKNSNLELYGLLYNKDGYPTQVSYVHGPGVVRTVDYAYKVKTITTKQ